MKRYLGSVWFLLLLLAIPLAASTTRIYVVNAAGASIDVIDAVTNKVVQTIEGFAVPAGIAFSPDGRRAYISDEASNTLVVLETKTGNVIKRVPLTGHPNLPAITPDGKRVLVNIHENPPLAGVDVIDTASLERVKTIPMKTRMHDIYISADGKYAVSGAHHHAAVVIDLQTEQVAWEVPFENDVATMAIENGANGAPRRVFVQLTRLNGFAVVDFAQRKEVARIKLPDEPTGYSDRKDAHGSGVAPDGKTLWVNSRPADAVFVYSLPDLKLLGHVPLPKVNLPGKPPLSGDPHWLSFSPDSKKVYIANSDAKILSVIDAKAMKEVARVPVGEGAKQVFTLVMP